MSVENRSIITGELKTVLTLRLDSIGYKYESVEEFLHLIEWYVKTCNLDITVLNREARVYMNSVESLTGFSDKTFDSEMNLMNFEDDVEVLKGLLDRMEEDFKVAKFRDVCISKYADLKFKTLDFLNWGIDNSVSAETTKKSRNFILFLEKEMESLGVDNESLLRPKRNFSSES